MGVLTFKNIQLTRIQLVIEKSKRETKPSTCLTAVLAVAIFRAGRREI